MLLKKITSDYLFTIITELIVLLAGLIVYRLAVSDLSNDDFSVYALSRRTISFIQPLLILGLGVGIPRYIAFTSADKTYKEAGTYFISGLLIIHITAALFLFFFNLFNFRFAFLIFGSQDFHFLIPYLSIMLWGIIAHSTAYSYLRGRIQMVQANVLQLINLGISPLVVFYFTNDIKQILMFTGVLWILFSFIYIICILSTTTWKNENIISAGKELLVYGIQRVTGDVVLTGFLALPAYFTAHIINDNLHTAGFVALGMSLLNMAGSAFGPICLLLLPQASMASAKKEFSLLKHYTNKVTIFTLLVTLTGLFVVESFTKELIDIYLGKSYVDLIICVRIIMFASIGYTMYISLRSILDAYYVKAVNTKNILISFLLFLLSSGYFILIGSDYLFILYSFIGGMSLLGLLTYLEIINIYGKESMR